MVASGAGLQVPADFVVGMVFDTSKRLIAANGWVVYSGKDRKKPVALPANAKMPALAGKDAATPLAQEGGAATKSTTGKRAKGKRANQ